MFSKGVRLQISAWHIFLGLIEALLITTSLALFMYGYPDAARKALWEEGGANGFNSNPKLRIYFYANHREPPEIPFIWSQRSTDFNLSVAVITVCIFCTRIILKSMGVMEKWTQLFLNCCVLPFWLVSIIAQQSPDYSDAETPSRMPWYLSKTCSVAKSENRAFCRVAQASFGISLVIFCFYACVIWQVVAYEGFDWLLKRCLVSATDLHLARENHQTKDECGSDEGECSDDDSPLMKAWDEV